MKYIFVLGRHPDLSQLEIQAVLKRKGITYAEVAMSEKMLIIDTPQPIPADIIDILGGTDRLGVIQAEYTAPWQAEHLAGLVTTPEASKINLGLSLLTTERNAHFPIKRLASDIKKILRSQGVSLRFIVSEQGTLINAAQHIFNKLSDSPNCELVLVAHADRYYVAKVLAIQDIQAYERRDTSRPVRDAYVGMLPPKLAQIMLNLATTPLPKSQNLTFFDSFCGLGTIIQEGWLMDYTMYGTDSNPDMISATQENLKYLQDNFKVNPALSPTLKQHDARHPFPRDWKNKFDAIVTEPYLGKPLLTPPSPDEIHSSIQVLSKLYNDFFIQALDILKPQGTILFALPVYVSKNHYALFPQIFIDQIAKIGYRSVQLIPRDKSVYARPDAIIGRELTLWQKL